MFKTVLWIQHSSKQITVESHGNVCRTRHKQRHEMWEPDNLVKQTLDATVTYFIDV